LLPLQSKFEKEKKMYLSKEFKQDIFKNNSLTQKTTDTGSPEAQIALFTERILHITNHLQTSKKDYSSRNGLMKLVGKRRRLLNYLEKNDIGRYRAIIAKLGLRK
jgi:small subunit ribosomal protein S15